VFLLLLLLLLAFNCYILILVHDNSCDLECECFHIQPLIDCYSKLRETGRVVLMSLSETWLRNYQVSIRNVNHLICKTSLQKT